MPDVPVKFEDYEGKPELLQAILSNHFEKMIKELLISEDNMSEEEASFYS